MKIRIAAAALGLGALLVVPATNSYASLTPSQCTTLQGSINQMNSAIASWSPWAPLSAKNKLIARRDAAQAKYNANC